MRTWASSSARRILARIDAECRTHHRVDVEHVLLGLLDSEGNTFVEVIRHLGADPGLVQARVRARLEGAPWINRRVTPR